MKYIKLIPYLIIAFLLIRIVYLNKQNVLLLDKTATLEENLKHKTVIYKDKIVYKERTNDSVTGTSVKQETIYIPQEGKVEILTPEEGKDLDLHLTDKVFNEIIKQEDGTIIKVQTRGFTLSPEVVLLYSEKLEFGGQLKLFYLSRYGLGIGFTNEQTLYGYLSRNISDILPFLHNTSAQISYGKDLDNGNMKILFGVNVRL